MYVPEINDYVLWKPHIQGWVYYKDVEYITIETMVRPKDDTDLLDSPFHVNTRLLVLCYANQWKELNYIKSRESVMDLC